MKNPPLIHTGFTLIEILLVLSMAVLAMTYIVPRFRDVNETQTIKSAGATLKNYLRTIQSNATAGLKPTSGCTTLESYNARFSNTSSDCTSTRQGCIVSNPVCSPEGLLTGKSYKLPEGTFIYGTTMPPDLEFYTLGKGTSNITTVSVENSKENKFYTICVATSGEIRDCGYSSGGSPGACSQPCN